MPKSKSEKTDNTPKIKYYSLNDILKKNAQYNIIFGERSNGKSYSALKYGLENFIKTGKQFAIVRRYDDDITKGKGDNFFDALIENKEIEKLTKGKYTEVYYYNRRFYLSYFDETLNKRITDNKPFAYTFALNIASRYKSNSYPEITTIIFDEFLERKFYLPTEFTDFMSIISTIVRARNDVKIFMLGNTVNKFCPYFIEMGLKHIANMKQGSIDVYNYGESKLKVAVEYCSNLNKGKPSDVYFAFDNPKLQMITSGVWEVAMYPHCPCKYLPKDIILTYFIKFDDNILQCEIVENGTMSFTFIHRKTTPIKDDDNDIIYSLEYNPKPNYVRRMNKPTTKWQKMIAKYYIEDKVFYQDNEVGELVRNFLNVSCNDKIR